MKLYSIMPLDYISEHLEEVCQDIRGQYESGAADCALLMMTLVPEGDPPIDKARIYCEQYDRVRDRLAELGLECGILAQATIGHGWKLNRRSPFQPYVGLADGREASVCCPCDDGFRSYIRGAMAELARHRPKIIMVDDDFRLMFARSQGCACPKHMAAFNRMAGTNMTREQLLVHTQGTSSDDKRYTDIFIETQRQSLVDAAKAMREGIDSVDPRLTGAFCACGPAAEFAGEIAQILAGEGNPVIVRVNNGWYAQQGTKGFSGRMYTAAVQAERLRGKADVLLAETDTCPQNRYSTGAQSLHAHFTGSILEGMNGAKHWITRLHTFEPASGAEYRRKLAKNRGFYEALAELTPKIRWLGCRIPIASEPGYGFATSPEVHEQNGWPTCVLERMGLPMYFAQVNGGAAFLDGPADLHMSDDDVRALFAGPVFLSSETAMRLNERGFSNLTGVDVRPWTGRNASGETLFVNGGSCSAQMQICELIPRSSDVRADSMVYHVPDGRTKEPLFPGVTVYKNPLGGRSVVFCGTPKAQFNIVEAFSFLNESRKAQLVRLLKECGCLPVWYPGDAEVYLRAGRCPDGSILCAIFNLGFDMLEEIELCTEGGVDRVERLTCEGVRVPCVHRAVNGRIIVETSAFALEPVILFLHNR